MSYTLIGNHQKDPRANCDGYVDAMIEMMKDDKRIVHIDCDLAACINATRIQKAYPERFFNAGIAEANAMGVAAGMAATGMIPFMHSFGVFAGRRAFDQAFLAGGYSHWPIHVIGSDPGVTAAFNGATHMPFEDAGLYLTIPDAVVIDSADYVQTYALTKKLVKQEGITYMRLIRKDHKQVYGDGSDFEIGKGVLLKQGSDVTIVASGIMVNNALEAIEKLSLEGISASLIDMHTWKPLDEKLLLEQAQITGCVVSAENHLVNCGLGSMVAKCLSEKLPLPQEFIGNHSRYGKCGPQSDLEKDYGMTAEDIMEAALRAIDRKG